MRVLIVTGIFPPDSGGPATFVPHLAEALKRRQHEVCVITLSDVSDNSDSQYPFALIRIRRSTPRLIRVCNVALQLIKLGRRVDVVFVNGLAFESAITKFINRKPIVQKIVGDFAWERATQKGWTDDELEAFQTSDSGWKVELLKRLQRWWVRRADRIIVPSDYLASVVQGWGIPRQKITTVLNAVMPGKSADTVQKCDTMRIITIGRLVKWKRVDLIIEAIEKIQGVELMIVGDGPERATLERLAENLKVDTRIEFLGQMPHAQISDLLTRCHALVIASTYEGLPYVAVEAMGMGVPVIGTRAGGTPEVVQDGLNGKLVPPNDCESLVAALRAFVDDPSERGRLAEGALRSSLKFDFQTMVSSVEAVLIAAAATKRGKGGHLSMGRQF